MKMRKLFAMVLVLCLALSVFTACGSEGGTQGGDKPGAEGSIPSAIDLLTKVWDGFGDNKFAVLGGSLDAPVEGAPGEFNTEDADGMAAILVVPADVQGSVTEAASMVHMMNANTFTAAALKTDDTEALAAVMQDALKNNQWMCGWPEQLVIFTVEDYVVYAVGAVDLIDMFEANMTAAYGDAAVFCDESLM